MARKCWKCRETISKYQTGFLCYECQEKRIEKMIACGEDLVDAEGYAYILGLDSAEQLRRLARKGVLAPRVPEIRHWCWRKKDIETWFKQKQREGDVFRKAAMGIASNLRRCRNDPVICLSLLDKIGSKVYGQEQVFATVNTGHVEPINLVEVDKSVALLVLEKLPNKDFKELTGITDWEDLTYEKINEGLIVKLESYF